jgi:hypothetical protein
MLLASLRASSGLDAARLDDQEFVAPEARHQIVAAHRGAQDAGDAPQISRRRRRGRKMSFTALNRSRSSASSPKGSFGGDRLVERVHEMRPVGEVGQRVVRRQMLDRPLRAFAVRQVADRDAPRSCGPDIRSYASRNFEDLVLVGAVPQPRLGRIVRRSASNGPPSIA